MRETTPLHSQQTSNSPASAPTPGPYEDRLLLTYSIQMARHKHTPNHLHAPMLTLSSAPNLRSRDLVPRPRIFLKHHLGNALLRDLQRPGNGGPGHTESGNSHLACVWRLRSARCLLVPSLESTGYGGKRGQGERAGMTDGVGRAARGRAKPSRPGLSLATGRASPATRTADRRGNGTFHCTQRTGVEINGAIHLAGWGEATTEKITLNIGRRLS